MKSRHLALATALFATTFALPGCLPIATAGEPAIESLDGNGLYFVAPGATDAIDVGDVVDFSVYTRNAAARHVTFAVDGREIGTCDADDVVGECFADDEFRQAFTFETAGSHTVTAAFVDASGQRVVATQTFEVQSNAGASIDPSGSETEADPTSTDQLVDEGTGTVVQAISSRGYIDRDSDWHSANGGREWRVRGARVEIAGGRIDGSRTGAMRCVQRYGMWIERFADLNYISRASVIGALAMSGDCEAPEARPFHPLIRGGLCAEIARQDHLGLDAGQCRDRMQAQPDFAIEMAIRYLATKSARRAHHNDPPRMAAFLSPGGLHSSSRDPWRMRARIGAVDAFVAAYNAYRTWEHRDADLRAAFRGTVHARMIQQGRPEITDSWSLPNQTPDSVATAIASLHPRYVSGLVRLGMGVAPGLTEMQWASYRDALDRVRNAVRAFHQDAMFDVVLNARDYNDQTGLSAADAVRRDMAAIRDHLHPEIWFFDYYQPASDQMDGSREAVRAAIEDAHAHGEYVGGNTWGAGIPDGSDFAAMPDMLNEMPDTSMLASTLLVVKSDWIAALRQRSVPVIVHVNNDPQYAPDTESCYFMGQCHAVTGDMGETCAHPEYDFSRTQRAHYIELRAQQQDMVGFHFMYPVFFPLCPTGVSYDATADGDMMGTIRQAIN